MSLRHNIDQQRSSMNSKFECMQLRKMVRGGKAHQSPAQFIPEFTDIPKVKFLDNVNSQDSGLMS